MSWQAINSFLNTLAETQGYDRESLKFIAERHSSVGNQPTVGPGKIDPAIIESSVVAGPGAHLPSVEYDNASYRRVEYRVIQTVTNGKVTVEQPLFSFRIWPFPGNCGLCIVQWVNVLDPKPWSQELKIAALKLRARIARDNLYRSMFITVAPSFKGAEPLSEYKHLGQVKGRSTTEVYVLPLDNYLAA